MFMVAVIEPAVSMHGGCYGACQQHAQKLVCSLHWDKHIHSSFSLLYSEFHCQWGYFSIFIIIVYLVCCHKAQAGLRVDPFFTLHHKSVHVVVWKLNESRKMNGDVLFCSIIITRSFTWYQVNILRWRQSTHLQRVHSLVTTLSTGLHR